MTRVSVIADVEVDAPAGQVWEYVTDWSRHGDWIPLTRVEPLGGAARGVGGRIRAWSGVGPVGFWDPLTVTAWEEEASGGGRCALVHTGRLVKGDAEITVAALDESRSKVRWLEHFDFGPVGRVGWWIGGRMVVRGLNRALARMATLVEAGR